MMMPTDLFPGYRAIASLCYTTYLLNCLVHSYRRAFFPPFSKFGNNFRYVSIYGGVLSLSVKSSRTENTEFVNIPIFGEIKTGKY